jgi:hypothetical protein
MWKIYFINTVIIFVLLLFFQIIITILKIIKTKDGSEDQYSEYGSDCEKIGVGLVSFKALNYFNTVIKEINDKTKAPQPDPAQPQAPPPQSGMGKKKKIKKKKKNIIFFLNFFFLIYYDLKFPFPQKIKNV